MPLRENAAWPSPGAPMTLTRRTPWRARVGSSAVRGEVAADVTGRGGRDRVHRYLNVGQADPAVLDSGRGIRPEEAGDGFEVAFELAGRFRRQSAVICLGRFQQLHRPLRRPAR